MFLLGICEIRSFLRFSCSKVYLNDVSAKYVLTFGNTCVIQLAFICNFSSFLIIYRQSACGKMKYPGINFCRLPKKA